ncbi:cobyrinic acid a,c-diamide synthase [Thermosulfidibacter takaii ABI70S6]|uniref:Cobyrinic acid a,c-diamide synthase n=1 Tax=Thermosulfidibacter takaii (strain DSM 17441 / JCM 13301 / NBRC 103674 / ABI70S6) TaxID=1298851 RepID=A0A0S3QUY0_THET7|nr:ATP-binding protein [Thermosulfidibacter takaii]BAT72106.1 cobyrinic acid a,c-diamide synthase [Thermosulfidibacter takaii ABI70S6]
MKSYREIAIVSGKGGTGKTTLATSFALLEGKKVVVDADVDAPDMHIILKPKVIEAYNFKGNKLAEVDKNKCNLCGLCKELCRYNAIDENINIDPVSCDGCALCYFACPQEAITLKEKDAGMWFVAHSRAGYMVHARLTPGEENSGKLVTTIRNRAREIAEDQGIGLILIDGPPGIGCPVISTITGVDYVVAVTEPTKSAIHDLKRVVELSSRFEAKVFVVINRFDISEEKTGEIENWCQKNGIPILGRIPTDLSIPKLQAKGKAPVEDESLSGALIKDMWNNLLQEVRNGRV